MNNNNVVKLFPSEEKKTLGTLLDEKKVNNALIFAKDREGNINTFVTSEVTVEDLLVMEKVLSQYTGKLFSHNFIN